MQYWLDLPFYQAHNEIPLMTFINSERQTGKSILPDNHDIFKALELTPWTDVRVVILGQDPYPTKGDAMGLAFSVSPDRPIPASLRNIYKELQTDLNITRRNGDLSGWAKQGVLLLNSSLTVQEGMPNSHRGKGWEALTRQIVDAINTYKEHVVFILWGKDAQKTGAKIDPQRHCVIKSVHPSPLSASYGFFGSSPFSKTNAYLISHGISPINWAS